MAERPPSDPGHIPGPVYIPNVVAVRLFWELPNDKIAYNVLHARYETIPTFTQASVNAIFTAITSQFTSSGIAGALDAETTLSKVGLRDMRQDASGFGIAEWVSNNAGVSGSASGGGPMPHQIAFVVSLKSGFSRQANRGRVYLPGFNTGSDDGNGLAKATVAQDCVDFVTGIQTALNAASLALCIAHPARAAYEGASGVQHPARNAGSVPVTGITFLNLQWDTQRLRARL